MPRSTVAGNGNMLILFDKNGEIRDLYYPHAGFENHVVGLKHRLGISINNRFYWLKDFDKTSKQSSEALESINEFKNTNEQIELKFENAVYNEKTILIRKVKVTNNSKEEKEIKLFFNQEFKIKENRYRNTGFYYPPDNVVIHYRGRRAFLINIISGDGGIDDYTIGLFDFAHKEGSFVTAEQIELPKNAVEHGPVDSVIAKNLKLKPKETKNIYYTLTAGKTMEEVLKTNKFITEEKSPEHILKTTHDYWNAWKSKREFNLKGLKKEVVDLFYTSLFVVRSHVDNTHGGVIASGDTTMYQYGKDSYAYVWPRDVAFISKALVKIGYFNLSEKIIEFLSDTISDEGYILHKFELDKSWGSSWHPWINDGRFELPIQEDETAIILDLMWSHYKATKDIDIIEDNFDRLISGPADFLCTFVEKEFNLPRESYDLWEEKYRIFTYTTCCTINALEKASYLSKILGKEEKEHEYKQTADWLKKGLLKHLYDKKKGIFYKSINVRDKKILDKDETLDSSTFFGLWYFNILDPEDKKLKKFEKKIVEGLRDDRGGFKRFEKDRYLKEDHGEANTWVITTLWYIQLQIKRAKNYKQLKKAAEDLDTILEMATESGILPEQVNSSTKKEESATPLIWSHACYIETITMYIEKLEELGIGTKCLPN